MPSAERNLRNPRVVAADAPGGARYRDLILDECRAAGLVAAGVAPAATLARAREQIQDRLDRGLTNGMKFTFLHPERSTEPHLLVRDARSIIVGAMSYAHDDIDVPEHHAARVARYAWVDHNGALKAALTTVAKRLRADGHRATVFADDNAVVDREVAWLAGLGWYGKNANIITPGAGSMHVLGCVVTTADLPRSIPVADGCGSCSRCLPACPTGAIVAPGVIDAHRCLSWLLQKPGVFDRDHRVALGARIYGCDDCQTACPFNRKATASPPVGAVTHLDVVDALASDDATLDAVTDRWWVHERDMVWVRRNLLIVLGNIGDPTDARVSATLVRHLGETHEVLRAHAVWAAARLGLGSLLNVVWNDPSTVVRDELAHLPTLRDDLSGIAP
ncbi:MAG: tRNA epoxyqueuosine(34) reductase QueG [Actinomycetota bacterium]